MMLFCEYYNCHKYPRVGFLQGLGDFVVLIWIGFNDHYTVFISRPGNPDDSNSEITDSLSFNRL